MRNLKKFLLAVALTASLYAGPKWLTDADEAIKQAGAENKAVMLEFTGSDWCPPCKQLKKNVLDSKAFEEFAGKKLVLVELDFPNDKKKLSKEQRAANDKLSKKYKIEGFPTVVILDKNGKELGRKVGYGGDSAEEFTKELDGFIAKAK